ncbi:hypothetical protein [Lyngbya confervoides]|uniref:Uncharacterized protein n=1 Tax=Lyngbya confervoides BDU141951 TaxID=1574623 RepID=A0ABD4T056_9CYAN|nr:hypothetical protein [Lyngbya confervoides]MCM1981672.1 hypothetical protein [Lyngbya confervoides BDU141951]
MNKKIIAISAFTLTALFSSILPADAFNRSFSPVLNAAEGSAQQSENPACPLQAKLDYNRAIAQVDPGPQRPLRPIQIQPVEVQPIQPSLQQIRLPKGDLKFNGGSVQIAPASRAGLALSDLPGVRQISLQRWSELQTVPETGLYLVETPFVPRTLKDQLAEMKYTLKPDGTLLDELGQRVTLFVKSEVFEVQQPAARFFPTLQASLPLVGVPMLQAANPYPFSQFSWSMYWRYRGGFCRDYRAWTKAEAWGPIQGGYRPHTRINYIETRAEIGSRRDRDSCSNCDTESSYVRWDIGCFWPAHGGATGFHYANWQDGSFSATRTWSW